MAGRRGRRPEARHDPVAQELVDIAAMGTDRGDQARMVIGQDAHERVRIDRAR